MYNYNPQLLIDTTDNSNAILIFSSNTEVNLTLLNDAFHNKNEFSISTNNNIFSLSANKNDFYQFHDNNNRFLHDITVMGKIHTTDIYNPIKIRYDALDQSFMHFGMPRMTVESSGVTIEEDINIKGNLNIPLANLPKRVALLDNNNRLPPSVFPPSNANGKFLFGVGAKFGIGTTTPHSKLHVYDGHALIESGYVGINDVFDHSLPISPLHIRSQGARVGTPQIRLDNSSNITTVIMMAESPFIGIGTSQAIHINDTSLYTESNIVCDGSINIHHSIFTNSIYLNDIFYLDASNLTFPFRRDLDIHNVDLIMSNSDIYFNGLSTSNAILYFYDKVNDVFGDTCNDSSYRLKLSTESSNVLAIGTTKATQSKCTFYINDINIDLTFKGDSNLYIDTNKIITDDVLGDLAYANTYSFNALTENPFVIYPIDQTKILYIASENKHSIILLNDNTYYEINNSEKMYRRYPWFELSNNHSITKVKIDNGIIMFFTSNRTLYYNNATIYKNIIDCVDAYSDGISIYYYTTTLSAHRLIINTNQIINITLPIDITGMNLVYRYGLYSAVYYSFDRVYDSTFVSIENKYNSKDFKLYHVYENENIKLKASYYDDNTLEIEESNTDFIYNHESVSMVDAKDSYILFIDKDGTAFRYDPLSGVSKVRLSPMIFRDINPSYIQGTTYNDLLILFDNTYNTIFTKSFSDSFEGLARGVVTSMGILPANELVPIMVPLQKNNLCYTENLLVGSSMKYVHNSNLPSNSLAIENCVGIRVPPNQMYPLSINGNLNIIGGDILINGIPLNLNDCNIYDIASGDNTAGYINIFNFDRFFNKSLEEFRVQPGTGFFNKAECDTRYINNDQSLSNIDHALIDYLTIDAYQTDKVWFHSSNINDDYTVVWSENTSVVINSNMPISNTNDIIPALYVANKGNIRGIVCDDNIAAFSDERLKTNLTRISNPLHKVQQLNGYYYNRIDDFNRERKHLGLIAQEVEKVIPEVVEEFNGMKTISYGNVIALLVEAIKELSKR